MNTHLNILVKNENLFEYPPLCVSNGYTAQYEHEEFFSQLKHYIKKESPNTYEDIDKVIKDILKNKIQKEHLTNYLKHSYRIYK